MTSKNSIGKVVKGVDSITLNLYDNGYMLECSGQDTEGDWVTAKLVCNTVDEACELIKTAVTLPR